MDRFSLHKFMLSAIIKSCLARMAEGCWKTIGLVITQCTSALATDCNFLSSENTSSMKKLDFWRPFWDWLKTISEQHRVRPLTKKVTKP